MDAEGTRLSESEISHGRVPRRICLGICESHQPWGGALQNHPSIGIGRHEGFHGEFRSFAHHNRSARRCAHLEGGRIKSAIPYFLRADWFAAATALIHNAAVVTGDPDFKKLNKVLSIDWV
jgi:hypothetical protein